MKLIVKKKKKNNLQKLLSTLRKPLCQEKCSIPGSQRQKRFKWMIFKTVADFPTPYIIKLHDTYTAILGVLLRCKYSFKVQIVFIPVLQFSLIWSIHSIGMSREKIFFGRPLKISRMFVFSQDFGRYKSNFFVTFGSYQHGLL